MSRSGEWAEHVVIRAMSRMMQKQIWIVTSQESSTKAGYLLNKVGGPEDENYPGEPFLLGHLGEYHYISLGE